MTQENKHVTSEPNHAPVLIKRMLQGASIALVLIVLFLAGVDEWKPEWGKFWILKPLLIVPIAGAMGALFYHYLDHLRLQGGWPKMFTVVLGSIGYLVALWLGTVLGLNGTLWN